MTTTMPDHAITGRIYNIEPCPYCRDDATVKEVLFVVYWLLETLCLLYQLNMQVFFILRGKNSG